ncbi:MAG: outer membrane lipid asymmetry maintenance protein MlaD [Pseudomonadota bacterium]
MASNAAETLIGAAVLAAAGGFLFYAAQTADLGGGASDSYALTAAFRKAEGIGVGGDVRIAGVKVGTIRALELDTERFRAVATLQISADVKLPDDSDAAIQSEGLLGGAYVALTPGGSNLLLADGDEILYTQGSVNLLDLVGAAISGRGE